MFLRWTGAQTDKDTGIQKLKIVAAEGHYFKPYAKILLAIAAVRDPRHEWTRARSGLEDVFIYMMGKSSAPQ